MVEGGVPLTGMNVGNLLWKCYPKIRRFDISRNWSMKGSFWVGGSSKIIFITKLCLFFNWI